MWNSLDGWAVLAERLSDRFGPKCGIVLTGTIMLGLNLLLLIISWELLRYFPAHP